MLRRIVMSHNLPEVGLGHTRAGLDQTNLPWCGSTRGAVSKTASEGRKVFRLLRPGDKAMNTLVLVSFDCNVSVLHLESN